MTRIAPSSTIGILGGGQLGRMLAIAAAELGYRTHVYCPETDCPASHVSDITTIANYDDAKALKKFADSVDVITYEFENIPAEPLKAIAGKIKPGIGVLETCQHRIKEKEAINALGIGTAPFAAVRSLDDLKAAAQKLGLPAVLKTATMGYDGKGQWKLENGWEMAGESGNPLLASIMSDPSCEYILEGFVEFTMEMSVIVARSETGETKCYIPVENIHKHHILSETIAPARIPAALSKQAEEMAIKIANGIGLVGLLAVEMFVAKDGRVLVNELAPRPHNSGHWTIDACVASQFEQAIRAVCGLPLGDPARLCDARMLNLIGDDIDSWEKYLSDPSAKLHLYGKKESRPGRKMGHVTFLLK